MSQTEQSTITPQSTGSAEFVLFCHLMSIHGQLQNLNLGTDPELTKRLHLAHKDAIGAVSYLAQQITTYLAPSFAQTQNEQTNG